MVWILTSVICVCQIVDLSVEVMTLRSELQQSQHEVEQDQDSLSFVDVNALSRDDAERLLIDCMKSNQFVKAVVAMRNLRYLLHTSITIEA